MQYDFHECSSEFLTSMKQPSCHVELEQVQLRTRTIEVFVWLCHGGSQTVLGWEDVHETLMEAVDPQPPFAFSVRRCTGVSESVVDTCCRTPDTQSYAQLICQGFLAFWGKNKKGPTGTIIIFFEHPQKEITGFM